MLRTRAPEVSLWETVLPDEVLRLSEELARVDALLGDPAFFAPFVPFFDPPVGRPSTPMEVYLCWAMPIAPKPRRGRVKSG